MKTRNLLKLNALILLLIGTHFSYAQSTTETPPQNNNAIIDTTTPEATPTATTETQDIKPAADDGVITQSINSEISKSSVLSKLSVNVAVSQGVVTLSGNVDSDSQASSLIEIAQSVAGVKDVDASNLKVKDSSQPFQDMLITAKIKGLFIREEVFGTKDIASINLSVETKDGVVYLTGTIDNQQQIDNAKKIVEGVQGVKKVEYIVKKVTVDQQ